MHIQCRCWASNVSLEISVLKQLQKIYNAIAKFAPWSHAIRHVALNSYSGMRRWFDLPKGGIFNSGLETQWRLGHLMCSSQVFPKFVGQMDVRPAVTLQALGLKGLLRQENNSYFCQI